MASGVGFGLPGDEEEAQPCRSMMLISRVKAKAKNCRGRCRLNFCIWWEFTPGLGLVELSVISCGETLPELLELNDGFSECTLVEALKDNKSLFNLGHFWLARNPVTLRATRAFGNKFSRGSR
jgi:hypothetical protein